ncbi:MAG: hypothetical protein GPJ52_01995 [Candidatus Heimdallarchaeota archaeon]|nr:hypothetical protein [Candidatus Heimdallarchaeota archaeon]
MSLCKHKTNDGTEIEIPCAVEDSKGLWQLDTAIFGNENRSVVEERAKWDKRHSQTFYRYKLRKFKGYFWIYCQSHVWRKQE